MNLDNTAHHCPYAGIDGGGIYIYSSQKEMPFNLPIFPDAPGFLTLQAALWKWHFTQSSLIYTIPSQKRQLQKRCVSFLEECTGHWYKDLPETAHPHIAMLMDGKIETPVVIRETTILKREHDLYCRST